MTAKASFELTRKWLLTSTLHSCTDPVGFNFTIHNDVINLLFFEEIRGWLLNKFALSLSFPVHYFCCLWRTAVNADV